MCMTSARMHGLITQNFWAPAGMFNSQSWQVLINLLFASFGNIQYHIFSNFGKIWLIQDVGKFSIVHILPNVDPTCCHFCQSIGFHILQLLGYCQSWNTIKSKVWQCKEFYFAIVGNLRNATSKLWQQQNYCKSYQASKTGSFKPKFGRTFFVKFGNNSYPPLLPTLGTWIIAK